MSFGEAFSFRALILGLLPYLLNPIIIRLQAVDPSGVYIS